MESSAHRQAGVFLSREGTTLLTAFCRETVCQLNPEDPDQVRQLFSPLHSFIEANVRCKVWLHLADFDPACVTHATVAGLFKTTKLIQDRDDGRLILVAPPVILVEVFQLSRMDGFFEIRQDLLGERARWPTGPEQGFLSAMAQQPTDPAPQLAYADWLEERQDERAVILRLQAALPRTLTRVVPDPVAR